MLEAVNRILNQATPATRCLITVAILVPFYVLYFATQAWALGDADIRAVIRPGVVMAMQIIVVAVTLMTLAVGIWCWPLRRSPLPVPHLYTFLACASTLLYTGEAIMQGNLTSPANMVIIGNVVIGLMLLDQRAVLLAFIQAVVTLVLNDVLVLLEIVPYAPMLTPAAFNQGEPQEWFSIWRNMVLIFGLAGTCFFGILLFNQFESQRAALRRLSYTDVLTGLANRRFFMERLQAETRRAECMQRPFCLVLLDVDHFKQVNDRFGHPVGDDVLRVIAATMKASMRCPTDLPARVGGEEFAILLADTDLNGAQVACERLASCLSEQEFKARECGFRVTVSMGVVECRCESIEDALRLVDMNLYQAKAAGRNRIVASLSPQAASNERICTLA